MHFGASDKSLSTRRYFILERCWSQARFTMRLSTVSVIVNAFSVEGICLQTYL